MALSALLCLVGLNTLHYEGEAGHITDMRIWVTLGNLKVANGG